jgi:hypothetical protein
MEVLLSNTPIAVIARDTVTANDLTPRESVRELAAGVAGVELPHGAPTPAAPNSRTARGCRRGGHVRDSRAPLEGRRSHNSRQRRDGAAAAARLAIC